MKTHDFYVKELEIRVEFLNNYGTPDQKDILS